MTTKIYSHDSNDGLEILEEVAELPQPLFVYTYESGSSEYTLVSTTEIDDEDIERVAENLIEDLEEDNEDIYDDES